MTLCEKCAILKTPREREVMEMYKFKVTFRNDETGEKKTCTVKATGICLAIDEAVRKMMLFGWTIAKAELVE